MNGNSRIQSRYSTLGNPPPPPPFTPRGRGTPLLNQGENGRQNIAQNDNHDFFFKTKKIRHLVNTLKMLEIVAEVLRDWSYPFIQTGGFFGLNVTSHFII